MPNTYLAFDYGKKRIGVAVGQDVTASAQALCIISVHHGEPDWRQIEDLMTQWRPEKLIVGMPYNMDNRPHPLRETVMAFGKELQRRCQRDVEYIDERLSSVEAAARQREITRKKSAPALDSIAAQIILETWLRQ